MKKFLLIAALISAGVSFAQDVYFSNQPFELGQEPDPSKCKTEFSDDENIYGLAIFSKSMTDVKHSMYCVTEDGSDYYAKSAELKILVGGKITGKWMFSNFLAVGQNEKTYVFFYILPDPNEMYYSLKYPDFMMGVPDATMLLKSYAMEFKSENSDFPFTAKIKVKKSGNFSEDVVSKNKDVFYERVENKETMGGDVDRGAVLQKASKPIAFNNYLNGCNSVFNGEASFSKQDLFNLHKTYKQNYKGGKYIPEKYIQAYACSNDLKWSVLRNNRDEIICQESQLFIIVADYPDNGGIYDAYYSWDVFVIRKDYLGDGKYGDMYMIRSPYLSNVSGSKSILPELVD